MIAIKHIPVIGKFLLVLFASGLLAIGSVVFSTSKMQHIAKSYDTAINSDANAAILLARGNRALNAVRAAMSDLQISNTDAGNQLATKDIKEQRQAFLDYLSRAKVASPAMADRTDAVIARGLNILDQTCAKALAMGNAATQPAELLVAQAEHLKSCGPAFPPLVADLTQLVNDAFATVQTTTVVLSSEASNAVLVTYATVLGGLMLFMIAGYFAIGSWVSRPIKSMVDTMKHLAGGDLSVVVNGGERRDEIGLMARAVQVFKDSGLKLHETEAEASRQRLAADKERAANEVTRADLQKQQQAVVASLASGLERLSKGDLTGRLSQAFAEEYEKLRADFNATAESLQDALGTIVVATTGISTGSDEIAHASDDLARRTEQQAASLEETAAALSVITDTVKIMASNASDAAKVVVTTRAAAENSGAIVQQAVDAMGKIKDSSNQISNIIGVIDEIAFQTNLLALNAGVEAARAGDAGRGFAVVASEVRGLAQRSAEAAKEIKALISASTVQVENGVVLVDKTGIALKDIVAKVAEMDALVRQISSASGEQALGLAEINTAVAQMDQVVQQNAAMVEESTAAAHALKNETQGLSTMVGRFQIGGATAAKSMSGTRTSAPAAMARAPISAAR